MLELIFLALATCFEAGDDFRVIAAAMGQGRAVANFHVAVLLLVDGGIIGGVGHVDDQRDVRLERVGDLPGAEQADFFLTLETAQISAFSLRFAIP